MAGNKWSAHWPAALLAAAFFLLAGAYSVATPLFEAPDELWHYPFVWHLARTGQLPVQDPAAPQLWQQEGSQPPLYYALAALLTAPFPADDLPALLIPNPHADVGLVSADGNANLIVHTNREQWPWRGAALAVHLARFFSVALGTATTLTVYALALTLWPKNRRFALLSMAVIAFNPMFLFISGAVNNDNLIILLAALILWRLIALLTQPAAPSIRQVVTLGVLAGLAALTKISGLGLVGLTGLTLLLVGWRQRSWRVALGLNALGGLIAAAIAGWWYWRNLALYGDWSGTQIMVAMMGSRPVTPTPAQLLAELAGLPRSFWGLFGYFSIPMPAPIYALFNLIALAGLAGWLTLPFRRRRVDFIPPGLRQSWPILLGWLIILAVGFVQWTLRTPATQGRLLFPLLPVLAPLWAAGWLALSPRCWAALPLLPMAAVAVWVPLGVIAPAYAPPPPLTELPAEAVPLNATFGQTATLLGYQLPHPSLRPGETLSVTLYWRGEQPTSVNYSVFVHLVDEYGLIVAQRDVLHGPGVYPTGQWSPGVQFADTYALPVSSGTYAPASLRLEVGLYDYATGQRLPVSTGGDNLSFGVIRLEGQPGPIPNPQQLRFADGITLIGYDLDTRQVGRGQTVTATLYWQAEAVPSANYKVFVHLVGQNDSRAAQHDSEPQNGAAPTTGWQPGQTVIDPHPLTIAPEAAPGAYQIVIGLYNGQTMARLPLLKNGRAWVQGDSATLGGVRVE